MDVIRFFPAEGLFPLYRSLSQGESQMLRVLFGEAFLYPLVEGEPMDDLLFDVLAPAGMSAQYFFSCPEGASLLGTFELRDGRARRAGHPGPDRRTRIH